MITPANINSFIINAGFNRWTEKDLSVFYCEFNIDQYHDNLFEQFDIELPDSLHRAVPKRRAEFLAGRYCAKRSLEELGIVTTQIPIGKDRSPIWPRDIIGSISHSNSLAVATSNHRGHTGRGIGIDIENIVDPETLKRIRHHIASESELVNISTEPEKYHQLFTVIFSIKESFFKAAYPTVGRYFGFDAVSVIHLNYAAGLILLEINQDLSSELKCGHRMLGHFRVIPGDRIITLIELTMHD